MLAAYPQTQLEWLQTIYCQVALSHRYAFPHAILNMRNILYMYLWVSQFVSVCPRAHRKFPCQLKSFLYKKKKKKKGTKGMRWSFIYLLAGVVKILAMQEVGKQNQIKTTW